MEKYSVKNRPNHVYHQRDGFLSSSMIKAALNGTQAYEDYLNKKQEPSVDMDLGTASHTCLLENHKFKDEVVVYNADDRPEPDKTFGSKANKEWKENFATNAKLKHQVVLNQDQADNIIKMREIAMKCPDMVELIEVNNPEISFYVENLYIEELDYCFNIKVRPDILTQGLLADYKTFKDSPTPKDFKNTVINKGYDLSMALYKDILELFDEFKDLNCMWVVQNKSGNCNINFLDANDWIELGRAKYLKALSIIKMYEQGKTYTAMDDRPKGQYAMEFSPSDWDWKGYE